MTKPSVDKDVEQQKCVAHGAINGASTLENCHLVIYNVYLSYELTVLPLGGYPREMKTHPQKRLV